ncbi:MAG: homoserine kinase [Ignavibacteriales bacterium]|nr:homoserine kinase [Ignavibacteriales bacterium]
MRQEKIKVAVPASVSNVGPGFDILGFAVDITSDIITINFNEQNKIVIKKISGDNGKLTYEPEKNTCTVGILKMLDCLGIKIGLDVIIQKRIGIGSGLGSSAASAVGGVFALNELLGKPFKKNELLPFALEGEKIASRATHADNVAPCLFGGFILIRGYNPIDIVYLTYPKNLYCTIVHPQIEIETAESRKLLGEKVELKKAITQWGNVAGLIAGLTTNNYELIGRSIKDVIVEPIRGKFIPSYYDMKEAAYSVGVLGCNISGSGPALFALSDSKIIAENAGKAMKKICDKIKVNNKIYVSKINTNGPQII